LLEANNNNIIANSNSFSGHNSNNNNIAEAAVDLPAANDGSPRLAAIGLDYQESGQWSRHSRASPEIGAARGRPAGGWVSRTFRRSRSAYRPKTSMVQIV
jgi:hypothetical protein